MSTVLSGRFRDVSEQVRSLPLDPTDEVTITVEERKSTKGFVIKNGVALIPITEPGRKVTLELVEELLNQS